MSEWVEIGDNEVPVANFEPYVNEVIQVYENEENSRFDVYIKVYLSFENNNKSEEFSLSLLGLENIDWQALDYRVRIRPELPPALAKRYLADCIRDQIPDYEPQKCYKLKRLGLHIIEGEPVFCTGDGVIRPLSNERERPCIESGQMPYQLDVDPDLSEEEAISGILNLVSLSPNAGRVILTYNLILIMRKAYETVWKPPRCCPFIYGETGSLKTTFSQFLSQIYNRGTGIKSPIRLNSSVPAIVSSIYSKRDCVEIIDDLCPAEDPKLRREQESTLFEITRIIADGIEPGRMRGKVAAREAPKVGVIFTGEYLIGSGSNAARLLPVEMTPPDGKKLKVYQDEPLMVSTFYRFFIKWFVSNFLDILEYFRRWRAAYTEIDLGVHARLQETHFFFNSTWSIFLQFCYEKECITEEQVENFHNSFRFLLTDLVKAQDIRVNFDKVKNCHPTADYLSNIRAMYKRKEFRLASTPKQFRTAGYDGFVHKGYLCLYGKYFQDRLCKSILDVDYNEVLNYLEDEDALKKGSDRRTVQVGGTGGKRFYAIYLRKLED